MAAQPPAEVAGEGALGDEEAKRTPSQDLVGPDGEKEQWQTEGDSVLDKDVEGEGGA